MGARIDIDTLLDGFSKATELKDGATKLIEGLDQLKWQQEGKQAETYAYSASNNTAAGNLTITLNEGQPSINQNYNYIQRGLSYARGAALLAKNLGIADHSLKAMTTNYLKDVAGIDNIDQQEQRFNAFVYRLSEHVRGKYNGNHPNESWSEKKAYQQLMAAELYAVWEQPRPVHTTNSTMIVGDRQLKITQQDKPITELGTEIEAEFRAIARQAKINEQPSWFQALEPWEQKYLKAEFKKGIEDNFANFNRVPPSSLRKIPGLANYTEHSLSITGDMKVDLGAAPFKRFRHGVISPIDLKDPKEQQRLTNLNQTQLHGRLQEEAGKLPYDTAVPVVMTSLLTATPMDNLLARLPFIKENNKLWLKQREQAVKEFGQGGPPIPGSLAPLERKQLKYAATNHGINAMRGVPRFFDGVSIGKSKAEKDTNQVLDAVSAFADGILTDTMADEDKEKFNDLKTAIDAYKDNDSSENFAKLKESIDSIKDSREDWAEQLGKIPETEPQLDEKQYANRICLGLNALQDYVEIDKKSGADHNRELFKDSLEDIIGRTLGLSVGNCKSSKDRHAMEMQHTEAMLMTYAATGRLPQYDDKPKHRNTFIEAFRHIAETQHHQVQASMNGPGTMGQKNMLGVLPKDIVNYNNKELDLGGRAAGLNKPSLAKAKTAFDRQAVRQAAKDDKKPSLLTRGVVMAGLGIVAGLVTIGLGIGLSYFGGLAGVPVIVAGVYGTVKSAAKFKSEYDLAKAKVKEWRQRQIEKSAAEVTPDSTVIMGERLSKGSTNNQQLEESKGLMKTQAPTTGLEEQVKSPYQQTPPVKGASVRDVLKNRHNSMPNPGEFNENINKIPGQ